MITAEEAMNYSYQAIELANKAEHYIKQAAGRGYTDTVITDLGEVEKDALLRILTEENFRCSAEEYLVPSFIGESSIRYKIKIDWSL